MSEFRRNPVFGNWILIDSQRNFGNEKLSAVCERVHSDAKFCPFCAGNESMTKSEILAFSDNPHRYPNTSGWKLRVIPNNKPILQVESAIKRQAYGIYDKMEGAGAHEIIIETPEHNLQFKDAPLQYFENIYKAVVGRIKDLRNDSRFEHIFFIKKYGSLPATIMQHPHSQIIALPITPKQVNEELDGALRYFKYKERCVFCDIILQGIDNGARLLAENEYFIALCPYASRYPFEVWIMPKEHKSDFDLISDAEISALAKIVKTLYSKLVLLLDDCPITTVLHSAPLKRRNLSYYHWYIEIIPEIAVFGNIDKGTGLFINPVFPEEAARKLRG
ncbi:MAG: galactose-1-phosphate uridylyltransferase [Elusimicrobiota bacterium]|jgi:UDPglucose--hexose-1-phosphate uridylyltransferase|nr:galactose-1-phosphate uridylyltransferase [Elusimicrobiota bacterium]